MPVRISWLPKWPKNLMPQKPSFQAPNCKWCSNWDQAEIRRMRCSEPAPPGVVPANCKRVDWVLIACCERVVPYKLHTNAIGFGCFPYSLPPHSPLHTLLHTQTLPLPKSYTVDRCRICLQPDSALQIHPLPIQAQTSGMNGTFCAANFTAFRSE